MVVQLPSCTTACTSTCDMEGWTLDAFLHMGDRREGGGGQLVTLYRRVS